MKHRLFALLAVLSLAAVPLTVLAQDGPEMEEFTSEDGSLTLQYPADWVIEPIPPDLVLPGVMMGNTQETLDSMFGEGENLAEGQVGIAVLLLPLDILPFMEIELAEEFTVEELTQAMADTFAGSDDEEDMEAEATEEPADAEATEEATPSVGEIEVVEVNEDGLEVGYVEVTSEDSDGAIVTYEVAEGVIALVIVGAFPGEYTEEMREQTLAVAGSIQFTGTAEDLMNTFMGGVMGGDTGATLDGDALVSERCTVCHSRERIDNADKDEAGWTATVDRMISNGAELNEEEREAVIAYLVETH